MVAARQGGDLGGVLEQPEAIGPGHCLGVVDPRPQLEGAAVVGLGLDRGVSQLCRPPGLNRRGQRLGDPAGRMPVVGELGGGQRGVLADGELRVASERHGDAFVQGCSFARQEIAVHGLATEGVAERVELADPDHQLATDRVAERRVERHRTEVGDVS